MAIRSPHPVAVSQWATPVVGAQVSRDAYDRRLDQNGLLEAVLHALVLHVLPHPSLVSHIMITSLVVDSTTRMSSSNSASPTAASGDSTGGAASAAVIRVTPHFSRLCGAPWSPATSASGDQEIVDRPCALTSTAVLL